MPKLLHDTHFHLDLYDDIPKIIEEIEEREIYTIAVTNLPPLYNKLNNKIHSKYIRVALGFHPELVEQYSKYINQMWKYLDNVKYIGEVGLDLKKKSDIVCKNQIQFFEELIQRCNSIGGKIISVHSRGSEEEVLSILGDVFNGYIILHWYSGALKHLDDAIKKGFYFSVNYAMLNSKQGKKIVERIPENKILIESDGPFVKINKKIIHPGDLEKTIRILAKLKHLKFLETENILSQNFKRILIEYS